MRRYAIPRLTWPRAIILFFVTIAGGNIFFVTVAVTGLGSAAGYGGLLDDHPYQRGLDWDREQQELKAFKDALWRASLESSPVRLNLTHRDGSPVTGAWVQLRAIRPNDSTLEREATLVERADGVYEAPETLAEGLWLITLSVELGGARYRLKEPVALSSGGIAVSAR